jgi:hypothetical protein
MIQQSPTIQNIDTSDIDNWDDLELTLTWQGGLEKSLIVIINRYQRAIFDYAHKLRRKFPSSMRLTFDECVSEVKTCLLESLNRFDIMRLDPNKPYNIRMLWEQEIGKFNHNNGWAYVSAKKREFLRTDQDNLEDFESNKKRKADQMAFKASNHILHNLLQRDFMQSWFSLLTETEKQIFDTLLSMRKPKLSKACNLVGAPKFVKKSMRMKYNDLMRQHRGSPIH